MSSTVTPPLDPFRSDVSRPRRRTPVAVLTTTTALALGLLLTLTAGVVSRSPGARDRAVRGDERGLSQSAETAILLAGAVVVAGIVVTVITAFVKSKLPK